MAEIKLKPEGEVARLQNVIKGALDAMDGGRYGDARQILRTGNDDQRKTASGVLSGNGGSA